MFEELLSERGLSFDRLAALVNLNDLGTLARAAGQDPVRQSLLSRQIKEREEYFGVELIRRSGRGLSLTDAGKELVMITREHLTALTDFKVSCNKRPLKLTIAAGDSLMHWLLLPRLACLEKRLPNVTFVFLNLQSAEITKRLSDGTIDFGFIRDSGFPSPIKTSPLGVMSHSLFVSQLSRPTTDLKKVLAEYPIATLEGNGSFRRDLAEVFEKNGLKLNVGLECSSFPLIARALKSHKAGAILPGIARCEFGSGQAIKINSPLLKRFDRKIVLAWNTRIRRIRSIVERARFVIAKEMKF